VIFGFRVLFHNMHTSPVSLLFCTRNSAEHPCCLVQKKGALCILNIEKQCDRFTYDQPGAFVKQRKSVKLM
jgi:hypothetical protein